MTIRWAWLLLLPASAAQAGQTLEVEPGGTYAVDASTTNLTSIGMADRLRLQAVFGVESASRSPRTKRSAAPSSSR